MVVIVAAAGMIGVSADDAATVEVAVVSGISPKAANCVAAESTWFGDGSESMTVGVAVAAPVDADGMFAAAAFRACIKGSALWGEADAGAVDCNVAPWGAGCISDARPFGVAAGLTPASADASTVVPPCPGSGGATGGLAAPSPSSF